MSDTPTPRTDKNQQEWDRANKPGCDADFARQLERESIKNWSGRYSAQYILMEFNDAAGFEKLSEFTGLPTGVIASAMENIFGNAQSLAQMPAPKDSDS